MRIGLDVTPLSEPVTGVGRYTLELLDALHRHEPSVELRLMSHRRVDDAISDSGLSRLPRIAGRGVLRRSIWMHTALPIHLARSGIDLCHYLNYQAPLIGRTPYVVSLHDLSLMLSPESHPRSRVTLLRPLLGAMARRARGVISPSAHVASEIVELLGVAEERVHVVPLAAAGTFRPIEPDAAAGIARRHGLEPGFVLTVGTIEPRKNLVRLVTAYQRLRQAGFEHPLVICGGWGWKSSELRPVIARLGLAEHVRVIGYVADDELVGLLCSAMALAYPSLYEGFGLPILEAMACGTPVLTSDRGAMTEVAGAAAVLADPEDVDALHAGLERIAHDLDLRARLAVAGLARAAEFSWRRTARETVAVYRAALGWTADGPTG